MYLSLAREIAADSYCQGTLYVGALQFQTLELPWIPDSIGNGGKPGHSCVPPGMYDLVRHDTPSHPKCFALVNPDLDVYHEPDEVPEAKRAFARTAVLVHVANTPDQLLGCIGLGMRRGYGCVMQSRDALERFNLTVPWIPGHKLGVRYVEGVSG